MRTLALVVLSVLVSACATSGGTNVSAPDAWRGYNADERLRVDVLVVKRDEMLADAVQEALRTATPEAFRALSPRAFSRVQNGRLERADGCIPIRVAFRNPAQTEKPFFQYRYADTNTPAEPRRVLPAHENGEHAGAFDIEACHGYASLDVPYGYIREATFAEVSAPGTKTFFPRSGNSVRGVPGELYELVQDDKQYSLWLVVLD